MYNEVIVVEGIHDQERISRLYSEATIITTNGSEISVDTINTLITLSKTHDIILLLDPDFPGERIRSTILSYIPNCKQAFIPKHLAISNNKKKVGIEHASDSTIKEALNNLLTPSNKESKITYSMLIANQLAGSNESKIIRDAISKHLNIGQPNAKTFLKRINLLGLSIDDLLDILDKIS